jgi:signal transduction histidine kinase/CheY-like chemotaxis protein
MPESSSGQLRALVLAPTARDGSTTERILSDAGIGVHLCAGIDELCALAPASGALLLADESLTPDAAGRLRDVLQHQPPWSDLPVLVMTRGGADSPSALRAIEAFGNVTLLDRPIRIAMLVSALRTALRARARQYQLRSHLEELERSRAALQDADRRKDEFLAMLSHELRNPLAAIVNAAAVLERLPDAPARVLRLQEVVGRQSSRMARLLDDLLDVSRITQGRIELRRAPLDLIALVPQALESCRPFIQDRKHELLMDLPECPVRVFGDSARIEQALTNLLTNAAKYTPPGGEIRILVTCEDGTASVHVEDTGLGIAPELLPRIFDLFTQGERTLARSEGGVGIGLTMVKRLIELHGGSVHAASRGPDLGSRFTIRLPLMKCEDLVKDDGVSMEAEAEPRSQRNVPLHPSSLIPHPSHPPHPAVKVLLIEDNEDAAATLEDLLGLWGHEVEVAASGEDGLRQAEFFEPEAVLIDIGLPGLDGYEVARRLRQSAGSSAARLVAISGYGQEEDRRRSREAGFDDHLTKPVDLETLRSILAAA